MSKSPVVNRFAPQKSEQYCALAIICLSGALLVLAVGVFISGPVSIIGIISLCIGIALMVCCIVFFALYNHYLKQEESNRT